MTNQIDHFVSQGVNQPNHIVDQFLHAIGFHPTRFITQVVATLIRNDHTTTCFHQCRYLLDPASLKFWKTRQQNNRRATLSTRHDGMQSHAIGFYEFFFELDINHA